MKQFFLIFCLIICYFDLRGQNVPENLTGQVSYISSQNIYVRFKSTEGITAGDTLYKVSNGTLIPVLIVTNLSSTSCICTKLSAISPDLTESIIAIKKGNINKPEKKVIEEEANAIPVLADTAISAKNKSRENTTKQKINGSISAISYSDFSNSPAANSQRYRYTLSLDASHIGNSKFSAESYISFRYKEGDWGEVQNNVFNALKIYGLSLRYDPNNTTQISVGRKINPRISSMSALDGLQVEKSFGKFAVGALVGTRPDYTDYSFNKDLFQFGGYLAFNKKTTKAYTENSLAFIQQMNHWKMDRRFLYFQHSSSLLKNLYFFGTFEVDLYELKHDTLNNDLPKTTFSPTGIFLSLRYKLTRKISLAASYDARKNVMYYETYKSFIDKTIENEMRQGLRLQLNYRITGNMIFGLQSGYRFLKSDRHPSKNVNGFLTYSQIPGIKLSATLSATYLESNYMNGNVYGLSLVRDLLKGKIQTGIGYRYVDYKLPENQQNITQHIGEMNLSWQFLKNFSISANYEGTFEQHLKYNRIYAQLRMRF
jgi:hypothetical protein